MMHLMLFSERPPICVSSCMTISGERTASLALRMIFVRRKLPQIYASYMTISGERTKQHVIRFGELAAGD